jgi:hypothetical protein
MDVRRDKISHLYCSNILLEIDKLLTSTPRERLQHFRLVVAELHFLGRFENPRAGVHCAWAICPANTPFKELFVAREALNGTLVLATESGGRAHVVAYLTVTDQHSGSYLVDTDEDGQIFILNTTPGRSDLLHTGYNNMARAMIGKVGLEDRSILATGTWLKK